MVKNTRSLLLFIILFGTMFVFGLIENFKGVTFPLIKTEFDVSYEHLGMIHSIQSLSYVLFCLVGGILIGSFGVKKAISAGFIIMILGLMAAFFMPGILSITGALILICAGFGLFEVTSNALATQIFTSRAALLMNILHFFYGAGSSLSPRAAGAVSAALGWRNVYLLSIPLVFAFFILSILTRFPQAAQKEVPPLKDTVPNEKQHYKPGAKGAGFFTALKTPMVWIFAITLGLMVVVEMCSANWAGLYFLDVYNLDPKTSGAAFISFFYILFTISRLLSGFAIEKIGYLRSLFIATLAAIFIFILGFALGVKGLYILPVLGFFTAIFWPTLLATAMGYFKEDAPVMTSAIIVIGGTINGGVQFLIGLTNRLAGPAWGYRSCIIYALLVFTALIILMRCMRRPYSNSFACVTPKK